MCDTGTMRMDVCVKLNDFGMKGDVKIVVQFKWIATRRN